jgi:hypothetical protein
MSGSSHEVAPEADLGKGVRPAQLSAEIPTSKLLLLLSLSEVPALLGNESNSFPLQPRDTPGTHPTMNPEQ